MIYTVLFSSRICVSATRDFTASSPAEAADLAHQFLESEGIAALDWEGDEVEDDAVTYEIIEVDEDREVSP